MSNQEIIKTDNVSVRIMELAKGASTEWHYHTNATDFFVCLSGLVKVETKNPVEVVVLHPGQRAEINPPKIHRVINTHNDKSEYLLVQCIGPYDFIKV
jgi:quercetin dioxygenase-like cupin family protein